jgi:glycosyltransferase involved in cell wall biosynthesis
MQNGVLVDVFRLRPDDAISYHEFQNVDVVTGSQRALHKLLESGKYRNVLVHFLSPEMWQVLKEFPAIRKTIWLHGAEIQPWHRREFNLENEQDRNKAIRESALRMAFWREMLQPFPENLQLVFVSKYFAEEVFEDLGFRVPEDRYTIIHNPIDTDLFSYQPKPVEQRKRILSIRPYASRTYANDLSVEAILQLAKQPFFNELEFRIIGDGKLFEETLKAVERLPNIIIERRFLNQLEIAELHKEYGIFLVPSRTDTQVFLVMKPCLLVWCL